MQLVRSCTANGVSRKSHVTAFMKHQEIIKKHPPCEFPANTMP